MAPDLLDRPTTGTWPSVREWITDFLDAEGNAWDSSAAVAMTSEAFGMALTHADRPVCMTADRDGKAARVRVYAHTATAPRTEWTTGSPLVEDLLPRLRNRTRDCGAEVQVTLDGADRVIWFTLPRKARGIRRLRAHS